MSEEETFVRGGGYESPVVSAAVRAASRVGATRREWVELAIAALDQAGLDARALDAVFHALPTADRMEVPTWVRDLVC